MTIPYFGLVPYMLATTDLVFTTGRQFAEPYTRYLPIKVLPSPFKFPPTRFYQLWHKRTHNAPDVPWLRRRISAVADRLQSGLRTPLPPEYRAEDRRVGKECGL